MNKSIMREYSDGYKEWTLNGELHREDGPAREWADGAKSWYLNGKLHREDGPAVEHSNGDKFWHLNGTKVQKCPQCNLPMECCPTND